MSRNDASFVPRWASPPGRTIQAALKQRHLGVNQFGALIGLDADATTALLASELMPSPELAERLAQTLGSTERFWLTRFRQFEEDTKRLQADQWAQTAPKDLDTTLGWLPKTESWTERIDSLLQFFGVADIEAWDNKYQATLERALFRTTSAVPSNPIAIAAWLRRGQIVAATQQVSNWEPERFREALPAIRKLTWLRDPAVFLPRLAQQCAAAGVALVIVRAPQGCPASGAALLTDAGNPLIVLSARYRSDDHLWFTFFHESAHVLLHDLTMPHVDELDRDIKASTPPGTEDEANAFAGDQILPPTVRSGLRGEPPRTYDQVQKVARRAGVAPGLVVGQLQYLGILDNDRLNKVKRRYKWDGPSLGMA